MAGRYLVVEIKIKGQTFNIQEDDAKELYNQLKEYFKTPTQHDTNMTLKEAIDAIVLKEMKKQAKKGDAEFQVKIYTGNGADSHAINGWRKYI